MLKKAFHNSIVFISRLTSHFRYSFPRTGIFTWYQKNYFTISNDLELALKTFVSGCTSYFTYTSPQTAYIF